MEDTNNIDTSGAMETSGSINQDEKDFWENHRKLTKLDGFLRDLQYIRKD